MHEPGEESSQSNHNRGWYVTGLIPGDTALSFRQQQGGLAHSLSTQHGGSVLLPLFDCLHFLICKPGL